MARGVFGFLIGCSLAVLALLVPFPRLAFEQLANRLAEAHRQVVVEHRRGARGQKLG